MTHTTGMTKSEMDRMLEEVAGYSIELAEDPTLPHLGLRYLQKQVAQCRNYTNRTMFYLQKVLRFEKELKQEVKEMELDIEFKIKEKLSEDVIVRKQSSIEDRKAAATVMFKQEYEDLSKKRAFMVDVEETAKLLRMKYNDLQKTSTDIKLQRTMIKDDMDDRRNGGSGYDRPIVNQDRSLPDGMQAPVKAPINPTDLLNPNTRPADIPEPIDEVHANMISEFLSRNPEVVRESSPRLALPDGHNKDNERALAPVVDYDSLL